VFYGTLLVLVRKQFSSVLFVWCSVPGLRGKRDAARLWRRAAFQVLACAFYVKNFLLFGTLRQHLDG